MDTIKILNNLITKLEDLKDRPSNPYLSGYNNGISNAILLILEKIDQIENINN